MIKKVGMIVRFNVINYLIGEGAKNLFKNKKSTMSSLMIMCATMFIFGLFFVIGENINAFVKNVADAQGIRVFIKNDATDDEVQKIGEQILEIDGVRSAVLVSKEDAVKIMQDMLGEDLIQGYENIEDIIYPESYEVTLTDLELNEQIQDKIMTIDKIDEIRSANEEISLIVKIAKVIRIITGGILILLIIISTGIISNTIKLAVHARRKEISIMKYVGATNSFIRWPFIVEGIVMGLVAALLSVAIIGIAYTCVAGKMSEIMLIDMMYMKLIEFKDMLSLILTVYLTLGIGIGIIGSSISMKKYLDV